MSVAKYFKTHDFSSIQVYCSLIRSWTMRKRCATHSSIDEWVPILKFVCSLTFCFIDFCIELLCRVSFERTPYRMFTLSFQIILFIRYHTKMFWESNVISMSIVSTDIYVHPCSSSFCLCVSFLYGPGFCRFYFFVQYGFLSIIRAAVYFACLRCRSSSIHTPQLHSKTERYAKLIWCECPRMSRRNFRILHSLKMYAG